MLRMYFNTEGGNITSATAKPTESTAASWAGVEGRSFIPISAVALLPLATPPVLLDVAVEVSVEVRLDVTVDDTVDDAVEDTDEDALDVTDEVALDVRLDVCVVDGDVTSQLRKLPVE